MNIPLSVIKWRRALSRNDISMFLFRLMILIVILKKELKESNHER